MNFKVIIILLVLLQIWKSTAQGEWQQCYGRCDQGLKCVYVNEYYSQCRLACRFIPQWGQVY